MGIRNITSNLDIDSNILLYKPKNRSIYEKLIAGKTNAKAKGSPIINSVIKPDSEKSV